MEQHQLENLKIRSAIAVRYCPQRQSGRMVGIFLLSGLATNTPNPRLFPLLSSSPNHLEEPVL